MDTSQITTSLFVVTYGRAGSTLLQNMLNALPGVTLRGENNNLLAPLVAGWQGLRQFYPERISSLPCLSSFPHIGE